MRHREDDWESDSEDWEYHKPNRSSKKKPQKFNKLFEEDHFKNRKKRKRR